jgi:hypothetical protein
MLYPKGSQNASTQRIQTTTWLAKLWWVTRTQTMVIRLPTSSTNTRRNKSNDDAKPVVTPHRRSTVLVKHSTQRLYWKLGGTGESIYKKFLFDIQTSSVAIRSQVMHTEEGQNSMFVHTAVEYNKKNCGRRLWWTGSRCFFGWPSPFGSRGRVRENKAQDSVGTNGSSKQIRWWMIRLKRIYNFWCSMLVFTLFAYCFVTLSGTFMHFPELTY